MVNLLHRTLMSFLLVEALLDKESVNYFKYVTSLFPKGTLKKIFCDDISTYLKDKSVSLRNISSFNVVAENDVAINSSWAKTKIFQRNVSSSSVDDTI